MRLTTSNLATTIRDLRTIAEREPSTVFDNAVYYLGLFLEKLCTREIEIEELPAGTLRHVLIFPLLEYEGCEDAVMAKIRSDFEPDIDRLLSNFEEAYGLEPLNYSEIEPYMNSDMFSYRERNPEGQVMFKGRKVYLKRVR